MCHRSGWLFVFVAALGCGGAPPAAPDAHEATDAGSDAAVPPPVPGCPRFAPSVLTHTAELEDGPRTHVWAVGDLDGDGRPDVLRGEQRSAASDTVTGALELWPGVGDGTFAPATRTWLGPDPRALVTGDYDGDGALDVAMTASSGYGRGELAWIRAGVSWETLAVPSRHAGLDLATTDADADGIEDLVLLYYDDPLLPESPTHVAVRFGARDAALVREVISPAFVGHRVFRFEVGDLDGDGDSDVLAVDEGDVGVLHILRNDGTGRFALGGTYDAGDIWPIAALADVNRDGREDVIVPVRQSEAVFLPEILFSDIDGFASAATVLHPMYGALATADLVPGGAPELLVQDAEGIAALMLDTSGSGSVVLRAQTVGPSLPQVADVTSDGRNDLVIATTRRAIEVFPGGCVAVPSAPATGDGTPLRACGPGAILSEARYALGASVATVAVGDLDGDGRRDLVLTTQASYDPADGRLVSAVGWMRGLPDDAVRPFEAHRAVAMEAAGGVAVGPLDAFAGDEIVVTHPVSGWSVVSLDVEPPRRSRAELTELGSLTAPVIATLDDDATQDLALLAERSIVVVPAGIAADLFQIPLPWSGLQRLEALDVDGDGVLDLVVRGRLPDAPVVLWRACVARGPLRPGGNCVEDGSLGAVADGELERSGDAWTLLRGRDLRIEVASWNGSLQPGPTIAPGLGWVDARLGSLVERDALDVVFALKGSGLAIFGVDALEPLARSPDFLLATDAQLDELIVLDADGDGREDVLGITHVGEHDALTLALRCP